MARAWAAGRIHPQGRERIVQLGRVNVAAIVRVELVEGALDVGVDGILGAAAAKVHRVLAARADELHRVARLDADDERADGVALGVDEVDALHRLLARRGRERRPGGTRSGRV